MARHYAPLALSRAPKPADDPHDGAADYQTGGERMSDSKRANSISCGLSANT